LAHLDKGSPLNVTGAGAQINVSKLIPDLRRAGPLCVGSLRGSRQEFMLRSWQQKITLFDTRFFFTI
jgi:hypothetical protein